MLNIDNKTVIIRVSENSVSTIVYFLKYMKDEVKIQDKLDKTIIKKFTISTISTKTYYFKE